MKLRKKVPSVDGAITRCSSTSALAPARSMSAWSMWLAPATMAWTRVKILRPGRNPPTRPLSSIVVSQSFSSPSRLTKVATSTSPALATRFGSSKVTATRSIPRDTGFTESASFVGENYGVKYRNSPSNGGIFRGCAGVRSRGYAVDRGLVISVDCIQGMTRSAADGSCGLQKFVRLLYASVSGRAVWEERDTGG